MNPSIKPKVAFVVQRFGQGVNGGAEELCRLVTQRLSRYWDIDVLTSCAQMYGLRFENDFPEGEELWNGLRILRFRIESLRPLDQRFSELDARFLKRQTNPAEEQQWLQWVGPDCPALNDYLRENGEQYQALFFVTYLYATTTRTLPSVRQRSILIPTAHDELPIHGRFFDSFFYQPFRLFFCSQKEKDFLIQRTTPAPDDFHWEQQPVVSVGVDLPELEGWEPLAELPDHYFLYVGRIQKEKSVDELFDAYLALPAAFRQEYPLVLIGRANMVIPADPTVIPLGFVSEETKARALRFCSLFILPSQYESLSLSLLEAWSFQRPCFVNGKSEVLKDHCELSHGAWAYDSQQDFIQKIQSLMGLPQPELQKLGTQGWEYVRTQYTWDKVEKVYLDTVKAAKDNPWQYAGPSDFAPRDHKNIFRESLSRIRQLLARSFQGPKTII